MKKTFLLFCVSFMPFMLFAQDNYPGLVTDRPDQTESAVVVPLHSLQIETGFVREVNKMGEVSYIDYAYNSTLLRYGLLNMLELRLGMEYLGSRVEELHAINRDNGFGALTTGLKYQLMDEEGLKPGLAFLGNLDLPFTASEEFKSDHLVAGVRVALSQSLSDRFSVGYNLGTEWDGNSDAAAWFYSVSLGIGLTEKLGMFAESYGLLLKNMDDNHLLDAGFTFLILPNLQADLSGGIGLNKSAIDNFISFGFSYRIPGPKHSN